ncbi:MAG: hypothetical protein IPM84_19605 [Anaerolineae bacterium]|nr:hypothetical protein [Anaerolineae bacterium]
MITATATLDQLNGWLRENGQFSAFGKDVESWSALCWYGAAWNEAALVLDACETAVKLAPKDGHARDGRGLARALTDDVSGAIEDFEFAVQRWTEAGADASLIASRTAWITALRAGKAPTEIFDAATLEKLRAE